MGERGSIESVLLGGAGVVLAWTATTASSDALAVVGSSPRLVAVVVTVLAVGDLARVRMPNGRVTAPVASAGSLALALLGRVAGEPTFAAGSRVAILLATTGFLLGVLGRAVLRRNISLYLVAARVASVSVVAVLARSVSIGDAPLRVRELGSNLPSFVVSLTMIAIAAVGVLVELTLTGLVRAERERTQRSTALRDELGEARALTLSLVVAGPLVALLAPALGLAAFPFGLVPMVLTYVAVRRYVTNQLTYRETIATLSRLTEAGGYTPPAHAERVARLAVGVGRQFGLVQRELRDIEYAALLHDVGQIALREPIPGGATVLAAPDDQRRIAADSARIIRRADVLNAVADLVQVHATPYRQVRELGEDVPLASRIIKVANAYDDLTGGDTSPGARTAAMERLSLGLGYEYDPSVVEALGTYLAGRT